MYLCVCISHLLKFIFLLLTEKIKCKANIAIDINKGRNMLGVVDETGQLRYGEVFVQYTIDISYGQTTKDTNVLKGMYMFYIIFLSFIQSIE